MIVVLMGVAGAGKTTVGAQLAARLHCAFVDGDALHPKENIAKMSQGIPLTDADRLPWLAAVRSSMQEFFRRGENLVVAFSALKQQYRRFLAEGVPITWVYLKGTEALLRSRLVHRAGHFMKADMLASQLAVLEEPQAAIVVDISAPPAILVEQILAQLPARGDDDRVN